MCVSVWATFLCAPGHHPAIARVKEINNLEGKEAFVCNWRQFCAYGSSWAWIWRGFFPIHSNARARARSCVRVNCVQCILRSINWRNLSMFAIDMPMIYNTHTHAVFQINRVDFVVVRSVFIVSVGDVVWSLLFFLLVFEFVRNGHLWMCLWLVVWSFAQLERTFLLKFCSDGRNNA